MRAHTSLRTAFRFGLMVSAVAGVSLASTVAQAGDVAPPTGGSSAVSTSTGTAALKYEHTKTLGTSIDTGFRGFQKQVLSQTVVAQVKASVKLSPVKDQGPIFTVDMPKGAIVEASWSNDKKIVLKANTGAQTDGIVKVRHSLEPSFDLKLGVGGINAQFSYSAVDLLNFVQQKLGTKARFAYDSRAEQAFAPWGWGAVDTKLTSPDKAGAALFTLDIDKFPAFVANNFDGEVGIRATTDPTFSYKTTSVMLAGADGPITSTGGETTIYAEDGDYLETTASVEGEMSIAGEMKIQPFIHLLKIPIIGDTDVDIPVTAFSQKYVGGDKDAAGKDIPVKTTFEAVLVHIPLPNVKAPTEGIDLGDVKAGGSATQTITVTNTGEMAATVSFKSSDGRFAVPEGTVSIPSKGTHDLVVTFNADSEGPAAADITVVSNDPDSPEQMFKIGANGADVGAPKNGEEENPAKADSGCGCKTAGTSSIPGWAGIGLMAAGTVVLARRRRK